MTDHTYLCGSCLSDGDAFADPTPPLSLPAGGEGKEGRGIALPTFRQAALLPAQGRQ